MTDLWYYAEGEKTRGPIALSELLPLLSRMADSRRVMVWRNGFDEWKAAEDVREVAQQLFRPPPLRHRPPSVPPTSIARASRAPEAEPGEDAKFKSVNLELTGVGGWLGLLAFGQVIGLLRLIVSLGQYYTTLDEQIWKKFPTAMWGEAAMNVIVVWIAVYTTVLLFRHSRQFPRFFIWQMIIVICMPLLDILWIAVIMSGATGQSISSGLTLEPKEGGQVFAGVVGALIWIPYIMRSRRVANTFIV